MGMQMKQPVIMDTIRLPCLRILQQLVKPDGGSSKKVPMQITKLLQKLNKA